MTDEAFYRIKRDVERLGISPLYLRARRITVGFSGGADSSLLLAYFVKMREKYPDFPQVEAVHVNHMLRGEEADRDEEFCRRRCEELGVALTVRRIDVPSLMRESGLGAEECARNARYGVFEELADGAPGTVLTATAHNADDNLETVLFNLARGSGAAGVSGIPPVRDGRIIRPLLGLGSGEIRALCEADGIPYVTDSTNTDEGYTRNYIRRSVVPMLKNVNPSAAESVLRCGIALREDELFFREAAEAAVGEYLPRGCIADSVEIPRTVLSSLPPPVLSRAITMLVGAVTPIAMSAEQIRLCRRLIAEEGTGSVSLPDSVTLEVSKNAVSASKNGREVQNFDFEMRLPEAGECLKYTCAEAGFELFLSRRRELLPSNEENIYKLSIHTDIRFDTIYGKMYARSRRSGDTLFLGGNTRRLKKMLCDRGVPRSLRERLPIICDGEGVLAVPGLPVRGPAYARECDFSRENVLYVLYCLYWRI